MHNEDIKQLLEHSASEIKKFIEQEGVGDINKVLLKNTLENLRSALDYLAKDVLSKLKRDKKNTALAENIYFPYGQKESHFKNSIKKNLPPLKQDEPKIYDLIEAIQPFKSKDNWVVDLCLLTNSAKHNNLSRTENKKSTVVEQRGLFRIENGASGSMRYNSVNGVRQDDVDIDENGEVHVTKHSGTTLITIRNRIFFHGKELEIVPFTTHCLNQIRALCLSVGALLVEEV